MPQIFKKSHIEFTSVFFHLRSIILFYSRESLGSTAFKCCAAAVVLGLSIARLGHSVALYSFTGKVPLIVPKSADVPASMRQHEAVEVATIVGGSIFQRADLTKASVQSRPIEMKNFKLMGTLEGNSDYARALLEVQGEHVREYCAYGNSCKSGECLCSVQGYEITAIAKEYVWLKSGSDRRKIKLGESSADLQPTAGVDSSKAAGMKAITLTVSREELRKISRPESIMVGIKAGPHISNRKVAGYFIEQLREDHALAKLGARSGDIIRKINGHSLDDLEWLMDFYKHLPTLSEAQVEIERGGSVVHYELHVRN